MITLRDYQQEAIDAIFKFFRSKKKGNPLVQAPTGSGKSVIISGFCKAVIDKWPDQKILIISHVKEILEQNHKTIEKHLGKKVGLYSAGLKSKTLHNITVAGIQSIYNKPEIFEKFNIIIVDEAHTIPHIKNGMYHKFFNQVKKRVIGFTATPYRMGTGHLTRGEGAFFSKIVYDIPIKKLQKDGYLCEVTAKGTHNKLDPKGIKKQAGDYVLKELSIVFDRPLITRDIIRELLKYKTSRKKWLLFAIDIEHAENITNELKIHGVSAACVHSKMNGNRDKTIYGFKGDEFQALVSVAVLTTGFDFSDIDLIGLLRPTESPGLHVQIIGRGLRPSPNKKNCLILDFAGNLKRLGPIDDPVVKVKGSGTGEAIMKECERCYELVYAAVRICPCCKQEFKFKHKLSSKTDDREVLTPETVYDVDSIDYQYHIGKKKIPMLTVTYLCGIKTFKDYVCLEHTGYAREQAEKWWKKRSDIEPPGTVQEAMNLVDNLKKSTKILVKESKPYPKILKYKL